MPINTDHPARPIVLVGALPLDGALVLQTLKVMRSLHLGRSIVSAASAFAQQPEQPALRVLLMGDSTGLGVGAQAEHSLAALLAADRPDADVLNVSRSGARLVDIAEQLKHLSRSGARWDLLFPYALDNSAA